MKNILIPIFLLLLGSQALQVAGQSDGRKVERQRKVVIIRGNRGNDSAERKTTVVKDTTVMTLEEYGEYIQKWLDSMDFEIVIPEPPMPPMTPDTIVVPNLPVRVIQFGEDVKIEDCEIPCLDPPTLISEPEVNLGFLRPTTGNFDDVGGFPGLANGGTLHVGLGNNWGLNLIRGKLRLWFGVRYDINNYQFKKHDVKLDPDQPQFAYTNTGAANMEKSKLVVNYLGVPVALGFQSNGWDSEDKITVRAGVNTAYLVRAHSKTKSTGGEKNKQFDDYHFNNFAITPFLYLGYNSVGIYARYTVTSMFKEGEGPSGNVLQFGMMIH